MNPAELTEVTTMFPIPPTGKTTSDKRPLNHYAEVDAFAPTDNFTDTDPAGDDISRRMTAVTICAAVLVVLVLCGVRDLRLLLPLAAVMIYAAFRGER